MPWTNSSSFFKESLPVVQSVAAAFGPGSLKSVIERNQAPILDISPFRKAFLAQTSR
jgi:hypothetical protein